MREMVLLLIAFAPPQQMLFGTSDVILGRPSDPIIVGMASRTRAHHAGDYFEGFGKWFHRLISSGRLKLLPLLMW